MKLSISCASCPEFIRGKISADNSNGTFVSIVKADNSSVVGIRFEAAISREFLWFFNVLNNENVRDVFGSREPIGARYAIEIEDRLLYAVSTIEALEFLIKSWGTFSGVGGQW